VVIAFPKANKLWIGVVAFVALTADVASSQPRDRSSLPRPSLDADIANSQLMQGLSQRSLKVGDRERTYFIHSPSPGRRAMPVVIALHGGNGTAPRRARQMGFNEIGDREGFIAVYPQGVNYGWNDGRGTPEMLRRQENADDVAFFRALLGELRRLPEVDPQRIYIVGGSNGGMMTHRLACEIPEMFAGAVAMVASLPEPLRETCQPQVSVPILMMNGTADPLVPYGGGNVGGAGAIDQGRVIPAEETLAFWIKTNACKGAPEETTAPDRDFEDGMRTEIRTWKRCRDGVQVSFYKMNGAGHGLPGRSRTKAALAEELGGRSTNDFDSSEEAWAFLKRFRR
jgi:polyhydroxybutyrate depolymerase